MAGMPDDDGVAWEDEGEAGGERARKGAKGGKEK